MVTRMPRRYDFMKKLWNEMRCQIPLTTAQIVEKYGYAALNRDMRNYEESKLNNAVWWVCVHVKAMEKTMKRVIAIVVSGGMLAIATASAQPLKKIGQCEKTEISELGGRLQGMPDSGTAVVYSNGLVGISYDVVSAVRNSRVGDPVMVCLVSIPKDCPKGDDRGKVYSAKNLRTKQKWALPDASHMCGGA